RRDADRGAGRRADRRVRHARRAAGARCGVRAAARAARAGRMSDALAAGAELVPGYEVLGHLKRTLVLDVYDVWSEERRARCVAKTLRPDCLEDVRARRALAREARVLQ